MTDFRVGQKIRIKSWGRMEEEFGLSPNGDISCRFTFIKPMEALCGTQYVIARISDSGSVRLIPEIREYCISTDMIEKIGINFK